MWNKMMEEKGSEGAEVYERVQKNARTCGLEGVFVV